MIPPDLSSAPAAGPARPVAPVEAVAAVEGQGFAAVLAETVAEAPDEGAEEGEPASQATLAAPAPQVAPPVAPQVAPAPILAVGLPQATAAPAPDEGGEGAPETKAVEAAGGKAAAPAVPAAAVAAPPPPAESGLESGGQPDGRTGAEAAEGEAPAVSSARPAAQQVAGGEASPKAIAADPSAAAAQAAPAWRLAASHGAEAAHAPRAPARARDVAEQITLAVATAAEPQVELRLDPPELGRVQIRLTHGETGLQAVVLADRPETQDFLRRNAEALRVELTEAGYGSVSLEFSAGQDAAPHDRGEETRRAYRGGAEPLPLASAPRAAALPGGLDIRL